MKPSLYDLDPGPGCPPLVRTVVEMLALVEEPSFSACLIEVRPARDGHPRLGGLRDTRKIVLKSRENCPKTRL
jgi:hypothetical protein